MACDGIELQDARGNVRCIPRWWLKVTLRDIPRPPIPPGDPFELVLLDVSLIASIGDLISRISDERTKVVLRDGLKQGVQTLTPKVPSGMNIEGLGHLPRPEVAL